MRLISGKFGGHLLCTLNDPGLRPAMAKTREALFSMLEARGVKWENKDVLDLFAGSGSIGLECLSRGCENVWFVENNQRIYECLLKNINALNLGKNAICCKTDVKKFLRSSHDARFDLIFVDPPYRRNFVEAVLFGLVKNAWLKDDSLVITETETGLNFMAPDELQLLTIRQFGQTTTHIFCMNRKN